MQILKNEKCLICNSKKIKHLNGYKEKGLIKCEDCSFVFMENIPTNEELSNHYEKYSQFSYHDDYYLSPLTVKSYNLLLDEFEIYRKTNKILDIGCGVGFFLNEAQKRGWEVYGTEYSETAIKRCRVNGIEMKEGELDYNQFDVELEFDVITSFEVIEHLNQPNKEVYNVHKLLRKGGLFYCTTPNFNSIMRYYLKDKYNIIDYPEHLSYYTKKTLSNLLNNNGFKTLKFLSTGISISRIIQAKDSSNTNESLVYGKSSDEAIRKQIESKFYLQIAKKIVNNVLTITNSGLTLKGYFIKK
jgi:2-polyprenyl-3-methyl-5-hydroxy-6-metoxy-1,4-benzoquinol methylase